MYSLSRKFRKVGFAILGVGLFLLAFGFATEADAATVIYRSVAPSATTAISTTTASNITLSISGATATFSSAQPTNMGVGDAIQYDSDNNGSIDSIAFIHGRTSSTVYTVKNVAGANSTSTSAADTDWSVFRAYSSLANAETGTENTGINATVRSFDTWSGGKDLVAADQQWNIALYANGATADTQNPTWVDGWTTSTTTSIRIYTPTSTNEVGISQRHSGMWDDTKYKIEPASGSYGLRIQDDFVWIDGIQLKSSTGAGASSVMIESSNVQISNNVVRGVYSGGDTSGTGISTAGSNVRILNNIVYGFKNAANTTFFSFRITAGLAALYNNTSYNSYYCFNRSAGATAISVNNIAQNCTDGFASTFTSSNYNISDLPSDAPGANSKNSTVVSFVSTSTANFHLASNDTAAKDAGTSLQSDPLGYQSFSDDIDREARIGLWDIGADEIPDVDAPVLSGGSPTGTLVAGTNQITLSLTTTENATCK